jgi:hypothetical protein
MEATAEVATPWHSELSIPELVSVTESVLRMLIKVYIDDSKDEMQERVAVAGAFLGFHKNWSTLRKRWKRRLKKDGLEYFRSSEYYSLRGEFERFRDNVKYPKPTGSQAAKKLRDDLDAIIHDSEVVGIAACVPIRLYRHLRNNASFGTELMPEDPFDHAIQELFLLCATELLEKNSGHRLAFICDDSSAAARIAEIYARFKEINPVSAQVMGGLIHQDDKRFPQLQAADLMAHLAKERFSQWLVDRTTTVSNQPLADRLKKLSVFRVSGPDRERLHELLEHERFTRGFQ